MDCDWVIKRIVRTHASLLHSVLAIGSLLLTSCACNNLSNLRDVPVSEITLAEPQIAEGKLVDRVRRLRADPSRKQELAGALAELSLVHRELADGPDWVKLSHDSDEEAKQAVLLLEPADRSSHAYFLTRRALASQMNAQGLHGLRMIEPLVRGNWPDLDKAQIYNDLAQMIYPHFGAGDYAVQSLALRAKAAGPHSLEVAESLTTLVKVMGTQDLSIDKLLCAKLGLPTLAAIAGEDSAGVKNRISPPQSHTDIATFNERRDECLRRAAKIREDILGSTSPQVADTLASLGEDEQLRAIAIYEKQFGRESESVTMAYSRLAGETKDLLKAQEYARRASVGSALLQAQNDPFKKAYVYLKSMLPKKQRQDRQDLLTKAFKSLGSSPPEMKDPVTMGSGHLDWTTSDSIGWDLDVKKLSVPELEYLNVGTSTSFDSDLFRDQMSLVGGKGKSYVDTEFRMNLPTWGRYGTMSPDRVGPVTVIGKGRIRFLQKGTDAQGYQQVDYKWNGNTFEEVAGKPGDQDAEIVKSAIDDAVNGLASYGIRGHHAVNHHLIENALSRANAAARELFKNGDAYGAADRLRIMFELTSDLVQEASTGVPVESVVDDSKDDVQKWIRAWTYNGSPNGSPCNVNLTAKEWGPYLHNYAYFRQRADDTARARKVLEAVPEHSNETSTPKSKL